MPDNRPEIEAALIIGNLTVESVWIIGGLGIIAALLHIFVKGSSAQQNTKGNNSPTINNAINISGDNSTAIGGDQITNNHYGISLRDVRV